MTEPLYSGEAICKRWGDSSSGGRTVTLQLEDGGDHPFRGYEGERFAIVVVPIGNDEKPMKKLMGDAPAREDGGDRRDKLAGAPANAPPCSDKNTSPAKPKKRWHEMPASERARMLVNDPEFQRWATPWSVGHVVEAWHDKSNADGWLKSFCGVDSKSSILPGTIAYEKFVELEGNFHAWRQAQQHGVTT